MDEEGLEATRNNRIFIGQPIKMDYRKFEKGLWELDEAVWKETGDIRSMVKKLVPGYHYTEPEQRRRTGDDVVSTADEAEQAVAEAAAGLDWNDRHRKLAEQNR